MRARIDTDDSLHPAEIIERVYGAAFFEALKLNFGFCAAISDIEKRIKYIGRLYIVLRREEDRDEIHRSLRRSRQSLKAETERFIKVLEKHGERDETALGFQFAAQSLNEPPPKTEFPDLTDHEKRGGEPYLRELQRLLKLLVAATELQAILLSTKRGPKINFGLEFIVRRTADLFTNELQRPFTIDHHKPFKPTEAFLFIRALIDPLDNVPDDGVVSAIRAERGRRKKLENLSAAASRNIHKRR